MKRIHDNGPGALHRDPPPRVTVLGGGNGTSAVLRGLANRKRAGRALEIRAIVATADDGGSSGRLRRQRGGLPPGDIRNCLLALTRDRDRGAARLFGHRFDGEGDLAGHALGNLMLSALVDQEGCYLRALERAGKLLDVCGRVLPVSLQSVRLEAETVDGRRLEGESCIGRTDAALKRVRLVPADVEPSPGVIEAIRDAELLVIGPGSLFTSLVAVLGVGGLVDAIRGCAGRRVLVANLMTQPGETLGLDLPAHLEALDRNVGTGLVEDVLCHSGDFAEARLRPYAEVRSAPVAPDGPWQRPERRIVADVATSAGKIRHDPDRLAAVLLGLLAEAVRAPRNPAEREPLRAGVAGRRGTTDAEGRPAAQAGDGA